MAKFRFSRRAAADLLEIGDYTVRTWGEDKAVRYLESLEACCEMLAANPGLGRACDEIHPGLRRMEQERHVIFYRLRSGDILISRILHGRMLPKKRAMEDDDTPTGGLPRA